MDLEGAGSTADSAAASIAFTSRLLPTASAASNGHDLGHAIPVGVILSPLAPLPDSLVLRRDALCCTACHGYIGPHCVASSGSWKCGLCATVNRSLTLEGGTHPELHESVVEYVLRPPPRVERFVSGRRKAEEHAAAVAAAADASSGQAPPTVTFFLVDDTAGAAAMADVLAAVRAALPLLPPDSLLGLLCFGRAVSVYLLGQGDEAQAHGLVEALVLPAADAPVEWELRRLKALSPPSGEGGSVSALGTRDACGLHLLRALEAMQQTHAGPRAPWLRRRPTDADADADADADSGSRGLVAAVDVALDLLALWAGPTPPCGQLVVCGLAGPPNYGPGALPAPPRGLGRTELLPRTPARDAALAALKGTGTRLARAGLTALVACAGGAACDVEALHALLLPCGGELALMRRPGTEATRSALCRAMADALGGAGWRASRGRLTVRCSGGLAVDRVIGGALPFDPSTDCADGDEAAADGVCYIGSMQPATCLSLSLDVSGVAAAGEGRYGVVQAAVRYVTAAGEHRLRTCTARALLTAHTGEWLSSLAVAPTALLACRLAAIDAADSERSARDETALARIAGEVAARWARLYARPLEAVAKGWLWDSVRTVGYDASAPPLPQLLRRLHQLSRSPSALHLAADLDAAHAARLLLLTAAAPLATAAAIPPHEATAAVADFGGAAEAAEDDSADGSALAALVAAASTSLAALSIAGASHGATLLVDGDQGLQGRAAAAHDGGQPPQLHEWLDGVGGISVG